MNQSGAAVQWLFPDTTEGEEWQELREEQQELEEEKKNLEQERKKLEREKREFQWNRQIEEQRMQRERQLFEMKWKILEEELVKLAKDKQDFEWEKEQYCSNTASDCFSEENGQQIIKGELFFSGVKSEGALKKRYKDLIKIFHPDNAAGDNNTLLEINREYDNLKRAFEG